MTKSEGLLKKLNDYCPGAVPMHMPGHKRNVKLAPYLEQLGAAVDITEINGFDDLHDADGVIAEGMERAARLWGAERSFFCVNGSTGGILASVLAVLDDGDELVCARNCHKAVYNALELRRAKPHFLFPERETFSGTDCIVTAQAVGEMLDKHPSAKAVIITSPTYEGVISDVAAIADAAHARGAVLIVDEAHGAHLGFGWGFPDGAVKAGADIVVQSLHKTLPSLTQTAIVHVCGERVDSDKLACSLAVFETSSPSYLLMSSIDSCVRLLEENSDKLFAAWKRNISLFKEETSDLKHLRIMEKTDKMFGFDPSKLVISTRGTNINGRELMRRLREKYAIELEMAASEHVIAMTGMGDTEDNLQVLATAICEIDRYLENSDAPEPPVLIPPERACFSWEAAAGERESVDIYAAAGRVSAEYVWAYPPGIPLLIPGEVIGEDFEQLIESREQAGISMKSTFSALPQKIYVLKKP
ncbi:MAG: aminotransferase class I/II-fold pyridoxal phosphate-dependent enzyme [Oscillospiraceae bacterium]|nr:aminotransferase class I/II-fold pyridoxal phosphate-dependent enzyme [Oscillospiraceae bacterium]